MLFESVWTAHCWPFSCLLMCREYICISGGTFNWMHKDSYGLGFLSVYLLKNTPWSQRVKHLISVCVQCALVIIENVTFKWPRHVSRLMRKCTVRIKYIIIGFLTCNENSVSEHIVHVHVRKGTMFLGNQSNKYSYHAVFLSLSLEIQNKFDF